ncbi:MAG: Hsp20/alpha crystallin family protein [Candidatus Hydrogenedentes bacterium]|nr:Hsp20/alpha crystallin family protein [Candidatus Hydrogenedentota bacterium]
MMPFLGIETLRMLPRRMMMEVWRRMNMGLSTDEPWEPLADIFEDENNFYVFVELPGVKKEDIIITLEKEKLVVKGKKYQKMTEEDVKRVSIESLYGSFEKVIDFREEIDSDRVTAEVQQGILRIVLPKKSVRSAKRVPVTGE